MANIGQTIKPAAALGLRYAQGLLEGITPENYARLPKVGGQVIQTNHAAFIFGHLALYPSKALQMIDQPVGATAVPDSYTKLFEPGAACLDDAEGKLYPPLAELTERFIAGYESALAAVAETDDAKLLEQNPNEGRSRELFPTRGAAATFYLIGHVQMHMGQLSAWRRTMGLGPVF